MFLQVQITDDFPFQHELCHFLTWVSICDMIKGNESHVKNFNFEISTPSSGNSKMLHLELESLTSLGKEIGLKGHELKDFIEVERKKLKDERDRERDDRTAERGHEKVRQILEKRASSI